MLGGADGLFHRGDCEGEAEQREGWWLVLGKTRLLNDSGKEPVQGGGAGDDQSPHPREAG